MNDFCNFYDELYKGDYREELKGYEVARWQALNHLIKKQLDLDRVSKVLDYGCGSGLHVGLWKELFPRADLHFCDISSVALQKLANKYPQFKNQCLRVEKNMVQIEDNLFDAIVSVEVMEHVEEIYAYLNDVFRLLKPGGVFIWTTPCANYFSIEHILSVLTNKIEKNREGYLRWKWGHPGHIRRFKSKELEKILEQIGFSKIDFKFRAHFFSFVCTLLFRGRLRQVGEKLMLLDYKLFKSFPNGASMIGFAKKL